MTGWRLGWVVGNPELVRALSRVKSYMDTGVFLAIQKAGAQVLNEAETIVRPIQELFRSRRDAPVEALADGGHACASPRAGMYLWYPLPEGVRSGPFAESLLEQDGLAVLPGAAMGQAGEGFVRLSFIVEPARLREAAGRMIQALDRTGSQGVAL